MIDAARVDGGPEWVVVDEPLVVPEDSPVPRLVLSELFARVEGPGPWRTDISPEEGTVHRLVLGVDGSVTEAVEDTPAEPGQAIEPVKIPGKPRRTRAVLIGAVAAVVLAAGAAGTVIASTSLTGPAPGTVVASTSLTGPAAAVASGVPTSSSLWSVPQGVSPATAAGSVVAGVDEKGLVLLSGKDGSRIPVAGTVKVSDTAAARGGAGSGLAVVDTGNGSGVAVVDGKAVAYEGKGALLARGPVPVLVGGTAQARKFYVFRAGAPVEVQPPTPGASLFGGLPGGGSVWAVAGGKVTYVPATGAPWTVALSAPVPGATVKSWVSVNERQTVVIWQAGASRILVVHATGSGDTGMYEVQRGLSVGDEAIGTSGQVLIGSGPDAAGGLSTVTGVIDLLGADRHASVPRCAAPVDTDGTLWCPADNGRWTGGVPSGSDFTVPGKPVVAGDGFVIVTEGNGQVAVPGPKAVGLEKK